MDLVPVAGAAIEAVRSGAEAKGIRLELSTDEEAALVHGDPDRLQQVLWNVLSNAVKFTPRGGRVEVWIGRVGDSLHIRVSDNGQGISSDFLRHVFERFRQQDGTSRRQQGGLGLGLAIVKELVELHGGRSTRIVLARVKARPSPWRFPSPPRPPSPGTAISLRPRDRDRRGPGR